VKFIQRFEFRFTSKRRLGRVEVSGGAAANSSGLKESCSLQDIYGHGNLRFNERLPHIRQFRYRIGVGSGFYGGIAVGGFSLWAHSLFSSVDKSNFRWCN